MNLFGKNKEMTCAFKAAVEADFVDSPKMVYGEFGLQKKPTRM